MKGKNNITKANSTMKVTSMNSPKLLSTSNLLTTLTAATIPAITTVIVHVTNVHQNRKSMSGTAAAKATIIVCGGRGERKAANIEFINEIQPFKKKVIFTMNEFSELILMNELSRIEAVSCILEIMGEP
ncbi:unnamed protein product [Trichobilharzia regenti]|nr:unnamed protein product [Trichobilharzia regenti]